MARASTEDRGAPPSFLSQEGGRGLSDECRDPGCHPHKAWPHPGTLRSSRLLSHAWALSYPDSGKPPDHPSQPHTDGDPEGETAAEHRPRHCPPRPPAGTASRPLALPLPPLPLSTPQLWNLKPKIRRRAQEGPGATLAWQHLQQPSGCDAPAEDGRASGCWARRTGTREVGSGATRTGPGPLRLRGQRQSALKMPWAGTTL